jgi:phosphatidylethanolamine-binding protein (PEBP) family uncharacterized protein
MELRYEFTVFALPVVALKQEESVFERNNGKRDNGKLTTQKAPRASRDAPV